MAIEQLTGGSPGREAEQTSVPGSRRRKDRRNAGAGAAEVGAYTRERPLTSKGEIAKVKPNAGSKYAAVTCFLGLEPIRPTPLSRAGRIGGRRNEDGSALFVSHVGDVETEVPRGDVRILRAAVRLQADCEAATVLHASMLRARAPPRASSTASPRRAAGTDVSAAVVRNAVPSAQREAAVLHTGVLHAAPPSVASHAAATRPVSGKVNGIPNHQTMVGDVGELW